MDNRKGIGGGGMGDVIDQWKDGVCLSGVDPILRSKGPKTRRSKVQECYISIPKSFHPLSISRMTNSNLGLGTPILR